MRKVLYTFLAVLVALSVAQAQIVITEISYNPPESGTDSLEFIEILNNGSSAVDLNGYSFTQGVTHVFDVSTVINPGDRHIVAVNSAAMMNVFGVSSTQWTSGGLSNGGEDIEIVDVGGVVQDYVNFDDAAPWPVEPDGSGYSLVLCDPNSDNNDAANWIISDENTGIMIDGITVYASPGAEDGGCIITPDVFVTAQSNFFSPADITIQAGETVEWTNIGGNHNVNGDQSAYPANPESFSSGSVAPAGWMYMHTFTIPGFYEYKCDPHEGFGMVGTVTVLAPASTLTLSVDMTLETVSANGVHVAGNFQAAAGFPGDWDPSTTQLLDADGDGIYEVSVSVPDGTYQYKFINGNAWGSDESVPSACGVDDGGGNINREVAVAGNTSVSADCFAACGACPTGAVPVYPIGTISTVDADGIPDSIGVYCGVTGTVYGIDMQGGGNVQFTVIDANNDGIGVFSASAPATSYVVTEGDMVTVYGEVNHFNGLAQISGDSVTLMSQGNPLFAPTVVTALDESTESQLVKIENLTLVDPTQWTSSGSFNFDVTDGTNTYTCRLDSDVDLASQPAPTTTFSLTGIGGQFDNSAPHFDGYQLLPRYIADLDTGTVVSNFADLIITEIMYNVISEDSLEFFEIYNNESMAVDLGGYSITEGVDYVFPMGLMIAANDYLVVAGDSVAFFNAFGMTVRQWTSGGLGNGGEDIQITSPGGDVVDVVDYDDGAPWPTTPDGNGPSLSLCDLNLDNSDPANWKPSTVGTGIIIDGLEIMATPGADNMTDCITDPVVVPMYPIGTISTNDATGVPDSIGVQCGVQGVVYGIDLQGGPDAVQFTLIDGSNDGIGVFAGNAPANGYTVAEGDEIIVYGFVSQFNGLTQMSPDSIVFLSSANALVAPTVITAMGEETESQLIHIEAVTLVNPLDWDISGSSFNIDVTDGTTTYSMRIDSDVDITGTAAPTTPFNLTGLGGQFDSSSPYDEGYQILPRYMADIDPIVGLNNPELAAQIRLFPNPATDAVFVSTTLEIEQIRLTNVLGQVIMESFQNEQRIDLANLAPGLYFIQIQTNEGLVTKELIKK